LEALLSSDFTALRITAGRPFRNHGADGRLGEFITRAMRDVARLNPDLQGVLDIKDHNERRAGQRTLDEDRLGALIEVLSRHWLGLKECRAYSRETEGPRTGTGGERKGVCRA
jgi:hypothetical protein